MSVALISWQRRNAACLLRFVCHCIGTDIEDPRALRRNKEVIHYSPQHDEYGQIVNDGGRSAYDMFYCPFCGQKLPESKRDRWFNELHDLGYEVPLFDESIPDKYKDDSWYPNAEPFAPR